MEKIHILTDSSADIPQAQVDAYGIEVVPITLTHEGRAFREYYDITEEDIKSKKKSREIAFPRQVAMYLLKNMTDLTFQTIGELLGVTNHTTVVYGVKKITEAMAASTELSSTIGHITQKIKDF